MERVHVAERWPDSLHLPNVDIVADGLGIRVAPSAPWAACGRRPLLVLQPGAASVGFLTWLMAGVDMFAGLTGAYVGQCAHSRCHRQQGICEQSPRPRGADEDGVRGTLSSC